MKGQIIIICCLLFIAFSCSKETEWMDKGKITGIDYRKCACCGGYFVEIGDSTYRFFNLPENSKIDLTNAIFPVFVQLNWMKKEKPCLSDEIIVTAMIEN